MANTPGLLKVRRAKVYIDDVHVGLTKGDTEVTIERDLVEVGADEYGIAPYDLVANGNRATIKFMIAEISAGAIAKALPEGTYVAGVGAEGGKVGIGQASGYSLRQDAVELTLHPADRDDADTDEDVTFWKCVSKEPVKVMYSISNQQIIEVTMEALWDETQADGYHLGRYGDADVS